MNKEDRLLMLLGVLMLTCIVGINNVGEWANYILATLTIVSLCWFLAIDYTATEKRNEQLRKGK